MKPDPFAAFTYSWADAIHHGYQTYDRFASPNANRANAGYKPYNDNTPRIVEDLPASYIDGGIILKKGITITREEFISGDYYEWKDLEALVEQIPNIVVEELLERNLLWIYDKPPIITSMAA